MQEQITEYNEVQIEERKDLPNLVKMMELAQQGDMETFDMFFYGYKDIERHYYDGKMQSYEINKVRFWDEPLSIFLTNIKKRYCKQISVGEQSGFGGRNISYKTNISSFEESEVDTLWYEWMREFVLDIKLENFQKDTEGQMLNAIRLYIRKSFQNHLKKVNNEKIKLERVRVDGELYYVKNQQEEVFFEDIYMGSDDEGGKMDFLDIVDTEDRYDVDIYDEEEDSITKTFINDNLEEVLTKKQYEKYQMLLEHVKEHGIESILDKHSGKIIKARVQRVMYPDKDYKNIERIDSLIKIMNSRMEKALEKANMDFVSSDEERAKEEGIELDKHSQVVSYVGGLSEEEVAEYFEKHLENILRAYTTRNLTFVKGEHMMLPSLNTMLEIPFEVYEKFTKSGKVVKMEIIREYHNPDKFKLKAGKKENISVNKNIHLEDKNSRYITPTQLKEIRRNGR